MIDKTEIGSPRRVPVLRWKVLPLTLPVVLILSLLAPSFVWIILDKRVWPWDQAWYGEVATDLYFTLRHNIFDWYQMLMTATPSKPPLLVWLGQLMVPFGRATGNIETGFLLFVLLSQGLSLWFVWLSAKAIAPHSLPARFLSVLVFGAAPLFVGIGHQFFVEALQTTIVSASLCLALYQRRWSLIRLGSTLLIVVCLGFAVKTTSVAYCCITWLYIFCAIIRRPFTEKTPWRFDGFGYGLLFFGLLLTFLVFSWYVINLSEILSHIRDATVGSSAELYGRRGALLTKLPFWLQASNDAFFILPGVFLSIMGTSIALVIWSHIGAKSLVQKNPVMLIVITSMLQIILPILMLASQPPEETRYLMAVLPNLALLAAWFFRSPRLRPLAGILAAAALGQAAIVNGESLGLPTHFTNSAWLFPIDTDSSRRQILDNLVAKTCLAENAYRYDIVGPEYPHMNANSMAFYAAKRRLATGFRCYYTGLGYAETDVTRALARVRDLRASYIIFPQPTTLPIAPDPFNQTLVAAEHAIAASPDFKNVGQVGSYNVFKQTVRP